MIQYAPPRSFGAAFYVTATSKMTFRACGRWFALTVFANIFIILYNPIQFPWRRLIGPYKCPYSEKLDALADMFLCVATNSFNIKSATKKSIRDKFEGFFCGMKLY